MSGPLSHPNIPSHVLVCQTCLDREAKARRHERREPMSKPGWGHPHVHNYKPTARMGTLEIERCVCGAVRHVVDVEWDEERRIEHETFDERDTDA